MNWQGPGYSVTLTPTHVALTMGGVTIPMPAIIAGLVGNALGAAMLEDLKRQRPTTVEGHGFVKVPLVDGCIS